MADGTNVGSVYFNLEIGNTNQIRAVVREALGEAQQETNRASREMVRSNQSAANSFTSLAKSVGLVTAAVVVMRKAWTFGKEAISLASDLQEVQNVVDVTFGNMSGQVDAFAKSAIESVGLSQKVAKQYMGSFGAMSKAFGFTTEQAYNMSASLTSLAGDVASFYNMTSDEAYTKLKSVFTGETESLKDLGVVMTQAALDAYALEHGFGKTTKAMSEQEKTLLRYEFVLDRLGLAQGDFLRTQDGWANQVRVLKLRFDELKATIGEGLIIALTPVVQMLNLIISKLIVAAQAFTTFIKSLFGVKETESGANQLADDIANAGAAAGGLASGTADTAKNLAKAKKQLMGFDKLYQLSDNSSSGSSADGGGIGGIGPIGGNTGGATVSPSVTMPSAAELGKKLSDFVVGILKGLKEKIKSVNWKSVGEEIGNFLKAVDWFAIFTGVIGVMYEMLNAAMKAWKGMFDAAPLETAILTAIALLKFTPLGGIISGLITKAIVTKLGADSGATIGGALAGWIGKGFKSINWGAVGKWFGGIGAIIGGAITAIKNFVDIAVNGFSWVKEVLMLLGIAIAAVGAIILGAPVAVAAIVAAIVAAVANLVLAIIRNWDTIKAALGKAWEWLKNLIASIVTAVSTGISNAWNAIKTGVSNAVTYITTGLTNAWNSAKTWASNMASAASSAMSQVGSNIKNGWNSVTSWFSSKLTTFKDGFVNIFNGIKNSVTNIIENMSNAFKSPINKMIDMLNRMIDGLNKLDIKIPDWVPSLGGKTLGFNIPRIPKLAMGGYVKANNPQLAIIGDNKREGEIVAPESKITEAVNNALIPFINTLVGALRGPQTAMAGGDIVIPVYIGNDLIDQYIVNAQTKNTFRSGR